MASEIWDLYDLEGRKTGETWERSRAAEIPEGRVHIVCDILIRHRDGDFLLTRRDPNKKPYPGCLEASAGGSALAGETPEEGARREMKEETGLEAGPLELISETVDYMWVDYPTLMKLITEDEVLQVQYPRYKPYLDQLES